MSIYTPEFPTVYGALDSSAFADGTPFSAHKLRAMAMSGNRLVGKAQQIHCRLWPQYDTSGDESNSYVFGMASSKAWPWWTRILRPVTTPKPPGANRCYVWIRAKITTGFSVQFALESNVVRTLAGSLPPTHPNVVSATGTGSFQDIEIDGAILDSSAMDALGLWVRGVAQTVDNEAEFGPLYQGTIVEPADSIRVDSIVDQDATWNTTLSYPSQSDLANGGNMIQLRDVDGNELGQPRRIVLVDSPVMLSFDPPLSIGELSRAARGGSYEIQQVPKVTIASFSVATQARTS